MMRRHCIVWLLAASALAHGPVHEQIAAVSRQIEKAPSSATLYLKRGELLRLHQEWKAALADLERAAHLDPAASEVHLARARLYLDSGQPALALPCLERFLIASPDHADALTLRGHALHRTGQPGLAAASFRTAIPASSTQAPSVDLYLALAAALDAAGQTTAAIDSLDQGIARLGSLVTLELPAIELERKLLHWDSALRRLDRLAAQSPRKETWHVRRAGILMQAGRTGEGTAAYRQALDAIAALPPHLRSQKATLELERTARAAVH